MKAILLELNQGINSDKIGFPLYVKPGFDDNAILHETGHK